MNYDYLDEVKKLLKYAMQRRQIQRERESGLKELTTVLEGLEISDVDRLHVIEAVKGGKLPPDWPDLDKLRAEVSKANCQKERILIEVELLQRFLAQREG